MEDILTGLLLSFFTLLYVYIVVGEMFLIPIIKIVKEKL